MANTCFTQLVVWQVAHRVALEIYRLTRSFPNEERYGLAIQMLRAAVSMPANIAEGFGRRKAHDKARFYNIAEASAQELKYHLIMSRDLSYLKEFDPLWRSLEEVCRMLRRLTDLTVSARDS